MATEVKSPNGNLVLNFTLEQGRPTYTLSYKGKEVVRPSHLGLELARDKHASMGLNENDLMDGFSVAKPDGAFYLFLRSPEPDAAAFCEKAKQYELLLVPSDSFGFPGYVRIAYCVATDMIERSLPAFRLLAESYGLC